MRSKASVRSHPIHPALIPFPFAFLTGALVFDGFGWLTGSAPAWTTGGHLAAAGVVTGLIAAVPGLIDYLYTVPPHSSGKRRATQHLILNVTAIALVASAWVLRGQAADTAVLAIEATGVALLVGGGWLGGVLVSRNQIGVDHRYARAGKWREATVEPRDRTAVVVASIDELDVDQMKLVRVGDARVVLARDKTGYVAFDDHCPHRGGSLADGVLVCGVVQCPWHGSQFSARTGAVQAGPSIDGIRTYPVSVRGTEVVLSLES
jgi:nitrite reductase/ring-hydroxylating ferredoxin subunit/uncharacterized membrane protein